MEVRLVSDGGSGETSGDDGGHGNRVRVQLDHRKHGEGRTDSPIAFALLLSFARHLIREVGSGDVLFFALGAAQQEQGASEEEMKALRTAVHREHKTNSKWPPGFF